MRSAVFALLVLCVGCGGGGGGSSPVPTALPIAATAAPTIAASATPTAKPSATASPVATASPSATPTPSPSPVPLAQRVLGGAPLAATASQLANNRRTAKAQGLANGLPILVESSGMVAAWSGDMTTWVSVLASTQDVAETSMTVTPSNALPITNPAPAQSCLGSLAAACIAHPTAFTWGTSSANGKPVGKSTLTIAFGDGTTGTTTDYVYDGWTLPCNAGWAYVGGVPVAQAAKATSDVYADCVNGNIVFPKGGFILSQPTQDQYGRTETIMPTLTAAPLFVSDVVNAPMASVATGMVFAIQTQDGGAAKVYFSAAGVPGSPSGTAAFGMALHAPASAGFAF